MSYSIVDIKNALARKLHGTSANQITDLYGLLYDTSIKILEDVDPNETRRTVELATPIYGGQAFDYACPADLKGDRIIDLRPQANRYPSNVPVQLNSKDFDITKEYVFSGSHLETRWNNYGKTLRISIPPLKNVMLNDCQSPTSNGLWVAGTNASGLIENDLYYAQGSSSIQYSLAGSGFISNSTMQSQDLTDFLDIGVIFVWTYNQSTLPSAYNLAWGSDASNYWSKSVTAQWDGTAFVEGWNLLGFPWSTATKTLTPDVTDVTYLKFSTTVGSATTPVYLDSIVCSLGSIYEIEYYSKYLFRDSTGAFKEKPTVDSDLINLDTDTYGVFTNCLAMLAAQQQQGKDSAFDISFFIKQYSDSVETYNRRYPSQAQKTQGSYYHVRNSSYARKFGSQILRP